MASVHFEVASGLVDGANLTFFSSRPYVAGTTAVFLNGQALVRIYENGWVETDPATGRFDMNEAPQLADTIQVFYTDADTSLAAEVEVTPISGIISTVADLHAQLLNSAGVTASVVTSDVVDGLINQEQNLSATLTEVRSITGIITCQ